MIGVDNVNVKQSRFKQAVIKFHNKNRILMDAKILIFLFYWVGEWAGGWKEKRNENVANTAK